MALPQNDEMLGAVAAELAVASLTLARSFATGATLWCWAPDASRHAQHVAVEFVHPVIVGTRALPAVAVLDDDAAVTLRATVRRGDVLLVIGGDKAEVVSTLRRAETWGVITVWIGAGPRPAHNPATHLLWLTDDAMAFHDGRLVLGYHLLWELTHVCFEHPGLLTEPNEAPCVDEVCITCSDEGRLAEVVASEADEATVRTYAGVETVSTALVGAVQPGDLLLVHAGTAITLVDA